MGSQLARTAVVLHGPTLPGPSLTLLMWICLHARDEDREPAYWAGRDVMAIGLGFPDASTNTARVAVGRALRPLVARGILSRTVEARGGVRQHYRITLWKTPPLEVLEGGLTELARGTHTYPSGGTKTYPSGVHIRTPEGYTGVPPTQVTQRNPQGTQPGSALSGTALHAREAVDNPRAPQPRAAVPVDLEGDVTLCGRGHGQLEASCPSCVEVAGGAW